MSSPKPTRRSARWPILWPIAARKAFFGSWASALESGQFKQGGGKLHDPEKGTHCCLGVACAIWPDQSEAGGWREGKGINLNGTICGKLGIWDTGQQIAESVGKQFLTNENDKGTPFTEIAAWVRAYGESL